MMVVCGTERRWTTGMGHSRLEPIDAAFLSLDGPVTTGHMGLISILDGDVTLRDLRRQLTRTLPSVPVLRRVLHYATVGIDRPWWVDAPDFNLANHVLDHRLPRPGTDEQLERAVVDILTPALDRSRPLWELHVVHGLSGRRTALVAKLHHAAFDGMGARDLLAHLFPAAGTPSPRVSPEQVQAPTDTRLAVEALLDSEGAVGTAVRWEHRLAREVSGLGRRVWGLAMSAGDAVSLGDTDEPPSPARRWFQAAPECRLNGPVTIERSWAWASVDLDACTAVRRAAGASVNDVLLAAVTTGLRQWLLARHALPERPLVAMIPISMRAPGQAPASGNEIALTLCTLPTQLADPSTRLLVVHADMVEAKTSPSMTQTLLEDVTRVLVPSMTKLVTTGFHTLHLADRVRLPFNVVVSNVPAGAEEAHPGGRRVIGTYPYPPLSDAMGLNVTIQGRGRALDIGVTACPALVDDVHGLLADIVSGYRELCALTDEVARRRSEFDDF